MQLEIEWWKLFNDAMLTRLVEQTLSYNPDLRVAEARLREARALRREQTYDRYPTVITQADVSYSRQSAELLLGERRESRPGERLAILAGRALGFVFVGPLGRYRPIAARVVAAAMIRIAKDATRGVHVYESDRIRALAATRSYCGDGSAMDQSPHGL